MKALKELYGSCAHSTAYLVSRTTFRETVSENYMHSAEARLQIEKELYKEKYALKDEHILEDDDVSIADSDNTHMSTAEKFAECVYTIQKAQERECQLAVLAIQYATCSKDAPVSVCKYTCYDTRLKCRMPHKDLYSEHKHNIYVEDIPNEHAEYARDCRKVIQQVYKEEHTEDRQCAPTHTEAYSESYTVAQQTHTEECAENKDYNATKQALITASQYFRYKRTKRETKDTYNKTTTPTDLMSTPKICLLSTIHGTFRIYRYRVQEAQETEGHTSAITTQTLDQTNDTVEKQLVEYLIFPSLYDLYNPILSLILYLKRDTYELRLLREYRPSFYECTYMSCDDYIMRTQDYIDVLVSYYENTRNFYRSLSAIELLKGKNIVDAVDSLHKYMLLCVKKQKIKREYCCETTEESLKVFVQCMLKTISRANNCNIINFHRLKLAILKDYATLIRDIGTVYTQIDNTYTMCNQEEYYTERNISFFALLSLGLIIPFGHMHIDNQDNTALTGPERRRLRHLTAETNRAYSLAFAQLCKRAHEYNVEKHVLAIQDHLCNVNTYIKNVYNTVEAVIFAHITLIRLYRMRASFNGFVFT